TYPGPMRLALVVLAVVVLACCAPPPAVPPSAPSAPAKGVAPRAAAPARRTALPPRKARPAEANDVRLVAQLQHTSNIDAVSFSRDGTLALTGGDASIKLWDTSTLTLLRTMTGHTAKVEE